MRNKICLTVNVVSMAKFNEFLAKTYSNKGFIEVNTAENLGAEIIKAIRYKIQRKIKNREKMEKKYEVSSIRKRRLY